MAEYIPADLNTVEPGDRLVQRSSVWGKDSMRIVTVTRVTKSQVLTTMKKGANETRWSKKTGTIVGSSGDKWAPRPNLYLITDSVMVTLRRRDLLNDIVGLTSREQLQDASEAKLAAIKLALQLPDDFKEHPSWTISYPTHMEKTEQVAAVTPYAPGSRYGLVRRSSLEDSQ
jgi:hypothetical protein